MNVSYVAACLDSSGYAQAARNHIGALTHAGVNVDVVPVSFEGYRSDLGKLGALVQSLVKRHAPGDIQILHLTPENYVRSVDPKKYNIGYSAWETDRLPEKWVPMINKLDEVWVPCEHNKKVYEDSGITKPIFVMPHPFDVQDQTEACSVDSSVANVSEDDFVFYSVFQWLERKNPVDLLKAYLTEFTSKDKVALVLKTYIVNPNNPQEAAKIKTLIQEVKKKLYLKDYPKILLISSLLSRAQICSLHRDSDCYVSLHRCEGFGIPIAEAMIAGKPVIATKYGGPEDFAESQSLVPYTMTPVFGMPWPNYTGKMNWAQPDLLSARKQMRYLYENQEFAKEMGEHGKQEIQNKLSWEVQGKRMKDRLEEIQKGLKK